MNKRKKTLIVSGIVAVVAVVGMIVILWPKGRTKDASPSKSVGENEDYSVEYIDADQYYKDNAKSVKVSDANDTEGMLDEAGVTKILLERGFGQYPITTEYSYEGEYFEEREITKESTEKHPVYQTYYTTGRGNVWLIMVVNRSLVACPVSYSERRKESVPVLASETDTIMSYDNISGKFFETIPNETVVKIIKIESISAEVLETITDSSLDRG